MTLPPPEAPSSRFAAALLTEFVRLGVRDVVLCPGSRSQALALVAVELERTGAIRLRVRVDERVAGFLALGIAVETGSPVVVITTSGTAVANLHPSVLEAHHSGVPLVILSADRPEQLRGIGSNQTTDQVGIFGVAVRRSFDIGAPTGADGEVEAAMLLAQDVLADATGPVHLNVAFAEPLSGPIRMTTPGVISEADVSAPATHPLGFDPISVELEPAPGTVVFAGHGAGPAAEQLAHDLSAPLIAEVSSGARFGRNLIVAYRELLAQAEFGGQVERVVVFGHPTLSREVPAIISRNDVETIVVRTPGAEDYNPGRRVAAFVEAVSVASTPAATAIARSWLARWAVASRAIVEERALPISSLAPEASRFEDAQARSTFTRSELARVRESITRRMLVEAVWGATWPHDRLVLGASRLIREADRTVAGKKITVHSNRGLAGIDGTISTAVGIALSSQLDGVGGVTRVLLGDLAALHDAGGMLFGAGEQRPRIQVIVGNDGGGTIFDSLEVARTTRAEAFDRALLTRQEVAFDGLAAAYGWEYLQVANRGDLEQALTASSRPTLIEVALPR